MVAKAEWTQNEANPRFVVTSLKRGEVAARHLYEAIYCARGEMENRIKECQLDLFADRDLGGDHAGQPVAAVVCFAGLRAALRAASDRAGAHAVRQGYLRHDTAEIAQDWGFGADQRAPDQALDGLGVPVSGYVRRCPRRAQRGRRLRRTRQRTDNTLSPATSPDAAWQGVRGIRQQRGAGTAISAKSRLRCCSVLTGAGEKCGLAFQAFKSDDPSIRRPAISTLIDLARQATAPIRTRASAALMEEFGPFVVIEGLSGCVGAIAAVQECEAEGRDCRGVNGFGRPRSLERRSVCHAAHPWRHFGKCVTLRLVLNSTNSERLARSHLGDLCEDRARAVKMGRKPKFTPHQQKDAIKRRDRGSRYATSPAATT